MAEIRWKHGGNRLLIPVAVFPSLSQPNSTDSEIVEALLDTGATGTGLRPDIARKLSIEGRGRRRVTTANGDLLVPEYRIRLGFYPAEFDGAASAPGSALPYVLDFGLLAHALGKLFQYEMLISMDVISRCDLTLTRNRSATLVLP